MDSGETEVKTRFRFITKRERKWTMEWSQWCPI